MQTIRVQFEVAQDKLPTVLALLAGEVTNIATRDMAEITAARLARNTPDAPPSPPPAPQPRNGRLVRVALKALVDHGANIGDVVSYDVIAEALEAATFSRSSHPSAITDLVSIGVVARIGKSRFRILARPVVA